MTKQKKRHGERRVWFPRISFFNQNSQKQRIKSKVSLKKGCGGVNVYLFLNLAFRVYC